MSASRNTVSFDYLQSMKCVAFSEGTTFLFPSVSFVAVFKLSKPPSTHKNRLNTALQDSFLCVEGDVFICADFMLSKVIFVCAILDAISFSVVASIAVY